ncbi:hypothetical protein XENTR_v10004749 [Xenopus tropicalis]|nr:hypothetical protein XENTR_v10004749 [Xenopus tropicalis]
MHNFLCLLLYHCREYRNPGILLSLLCTGATSPSVTVMLSMSWPSGTTGFIYPKKYKYRTYWDSRPCTYFGRKECSLPRVTTAGDMATVTLPVIPTIPRRHQYHLFWKPLLETGAKSISKRHVRRDWLIIPDTFAFTIYESVNNLYPPAGKVLMDIFETPAVQNTRGFIIDITSQLTLKGEELQSKITDFWNKISAKVKTDTN